MLNTVLSKIVRGMGCTTVVVNEVPAGRAEIGLGIEEFVADVVLRLRQRVLDGHLFRDLEILKLRGVEVKEAKMAFTLKKGFKAFPPFKLKPVEKPRRFQPIPDPPGKYSMGVEDLNLALGGGLPKGSRILLEIGEKVSMSEYYLILLPIMLNFGAQGRPVIIIPTIGVDAELAKATALKYGAAEDEINRLLRVCEPLSPRREKREPYIAVFEGKDLWKDYGAYLELEGRLVAETGQPALTVVGLDTVLAYYNEKDCMKLLGQDAIRIRGRSALGILVLKPGYGHLVERLSGMFEAHLKVIKVNGALLFYGVKPRTRLYCVETDVSKGYPMPKLTPIT